MAKWTYAEDYIVCHFYLNHIDSWYAERDILMELLRQSGFQDRSWSSVQFRIGNYKYLLTCGRSGFSEVAEQSKRVYRGLVRKHENRSLYETLQSFMAKNYTPYPEFASLSTKADLLAFTAAERTALDRIIEESSHRKPFGDALMNYIRKHGLDEVQVYKDSNIERDTFWRIVNNKNKSISRKTIIKLCIGLKLSYEIAIKFLATAGLAFDGHSPTEMLIVWCLQNKIYDTAEIDVILYEHDLDTLFSEA